MITLNERKPVMQASGYWTGLRISVRASTGKVSAFDARAVWRSAETWPLLVLSPWFLLLGTQVFLRATQPVIGRATYALLASAACALALAPAADSDMIIAAVVERLLLPLFATTFALFFCTFPRTQGGSALRAMLWALAGITGAAGIVEAFWPPVYSLDFLLITFDLLAGLVLGAGFLMRSFITINDRTDRQGTLIVAAGTCGAILPFVMLYLVPSILGRAPLLAPEHTVLALAVLPASFAYAILRYQVLPVHLLQRWLVHGLLWVGLAVLLAGAVYTIRAALLAVLPEPAQSVALALILVPLAGMVLPRLFGHLRRSTDRAIFQDNYDYHDAMQHLSRDISTARDLRALDGAVLETLRRLLNLDFVGLLAPATADMYVLGSAGNVTTEFLSALRVRLPATPERPVVLTMGSENVAVLLVPLHTQEMLVGYLCLGPKSSGEPLRTEDYDLLATVSGHLAAIVRNAALVEDLRANVATLRAQSAALDALNERLQLAQEEERRRLAMEIHDSPLQTAMWLEHLLGISAKQDDATRTEARGLSSMLVAQLRAACAAMRPAALEDLGLLPALDFLAQQLSDRTGIPIVLELEPGSTQLELSSKAGLVLYRATQEALNNSLHHAHPQSITISLQQTDHRVRLVVTDDGVGFIVPAQLDDLVTDGHLGLAGLRERVRHAGGRLHVTASPEFGTTVCVELPGADHP